jgi:hypothetical protein
MSRARLLLAGTTLFLFACEPELGECNIAQANRLAVSESGFVLYEGQAMIARDCSDGVCHAPGVTGAGREGVPASFDFGVDLACQLEDSGECPESAEPAFERLRANVDNVFDHARSIMGEVERGTMPPDGYPARNEDGEPIIDAYYQLGGGASYDLGTRIGDSPLPTVDSVEGQAILRNWLSCGAPVIGANAPLSAGELGERCAGTVEVGDCVVGAILDPPEPTWEAIYDFFSGNNCVTGCHEPGSPNIEDSMLDLSEASTAYMELMGESQGAECGSGTLVVPGEPESSLLIEKLEGGDATTCGDPMPPSGAWPDRYVEPVRQWIMDGAPES